MYPSFMYCAVALPLLYAWHSQDASDSRHTSGYEVDSIDDAESDKEASKLFQPSVEVCSCHEQHPPAQACDAQGNPNAQSQVVWDLDIALVVRCFNSSGLDSTIVHANTTILAQTSISENGRQDLEPEHSRTKDEDEDMTTDIVTASPRATSDLASGMSQDLSSVAHLVLLVVVDRVILVDDLALAPSQSKTAVDDGWAEEPLSNCRPDSSYGSVANDGADTAVCEGGLEARTKRAVGEAEEEECACYPYPADLDKVDVEDVGLEGEV